MIPKKPLDSVLDKSIILTITAPNDNAKSISVQCAPPPWRKSDGLAPSLAFTGRGPGIPWLVPPWRKSDGLVPSLSLAGKVLWASLLSFSF